MAFADLTVNYLCKAARVAPVELLVVAQDARFHALLRSLAIPSVDITALGLAGADPTATDFASAPYRLIVEGKMRAVREVLRRGLHVLFADVDAVLNGDPVPELRNDVRDALLPTFSPAARLRARLTTPLTTLSGRSTSSSSPTGPSPTATTRTTCSRSNSRAPVRRPPVAHPPSSPAALTPCAALSTHAGFYFIKSNARTRAFLDAVIDRFPDDLDGNDQASTSCARVAPLPLVPHASGFADRPTDVRARPCS